MYIKVKDFSEIDLKKYGSFRLCYIDSIEEIIYNDGYDPNDFRSSSPWIPNPIYKEGISDHYAYFTPVFDKQWGDDWNDAPYEHNAGCPYDDTSGDSDENGRTKWIEHEILVVPFGISDYSYWVKYPCDYGCGNSPFCVEDINHGAIPWIYGVKCSKNREKDYLVVQGGETVDEFIKKISHINEGVQ